MAEPIINTSSDKDASLDGRISVMPEHYRMQAKKGLSQKTIILVASLGILIVVIVAVSLLFMETPGTPTPSIVQQPITTDETVSGSGGNDQGINTEESNLDNQTESVDLNEVDQSIPEESLIVLPELNITGLQFDVDTDQDGLTDVEEQLFATSAAVPDTDQDNFLDGAEIVNLYDPATPGALLEVSPQIRIVTNDLRGYQLIIPSTWSALKLIASGDEYQITPRDGTELFNIVTYANEDRLAVVDWYKSVSSNYDITDFIDFSNDSGFKGIQSKDKLVVFATMDDKQPGSRAIIFMLHYNLGDMNLIRYSSVWQMMLNSFSTLTVDN